MECTNINEAAREEMTKMVEAGHFDEKPDKDTSKKNKKRASRRNPKKGAAFVAVKDESKSESEDKKLTLPTLEELLREQGYIQLNVGAERAWDGDSVSEFGFGCLHVGRARASPEPNGVVFAGAGDELVGSLSEWILVKGNRKIKTASTKTLPVSPPKQVAKKLAWIDNLSGENVPRQRVKKTRIKECGNKTTTKKASVSKANLANGKLSVLNVNRSVPGRPASSGRAGKPFEVLD